MHEFDIPPKLIRLTEITIKTVRNTVKIINDVSQYFETQRGLKQGDGCQLYFGEGN